MIEPLSILDAYGDKMLMDAPIRGGLCIEKVGRDGLVIYAAGGAVMLAFTRDDVRRVRDWLNKYLREESEGS